MVKDPGFLAFMEYTCPEFEVPSTQTISNRVKEIYAKEKEKLKEKLREVDWVAITTDGGTSTNAISYQDTNVHFLDENLKLVSYVLSVKENKEKHTTENYRANTDEVLEEFGLVGKVILFVTDNEPKMKAAYVGEERSGCLSHIIHKSVIKGLNDVEPLKSVVEKIRKITKKHNKSYAFRYAVENQQKKRDLKVRPLHQDVPTRWGSTVASTDSLLDHKEDEDEETDFKNIKAVNAALREINLKKDELETLLLTNRDCEKIKNLNKVLKKLDIYSTTLGGDKFVTSSLVFPIVKSIKKLASEDPEEKLYMSEFKEILLDDFKTRVSDNVNFKVLKKCCALNPAFKNLKTIGDNLSDEAKKRVREEVFSELEDELISMIMTERALDFGNAIEPEESDDADLNSNVTGRETSSLKRNLTLDFDESDEEEENSGLNYENVKNEFAAYNAEPIMSRDSCPLEWWDARKGKYPHLLKLVRKYLCIPATSTQAERVFSGLGLLLTKQRLSMSGDLVDAQLFLKDKFVF